MKKNMIPAAILLILAAAAAIGSQSFLAPCIHDDGSFGACHWAGQALCGLGCALALIAAMCLCLRRARFGLYLGAAPVCLLGILTPGTLIDLCRMSTMRCRTVTQPAMIILFSAALVCALAGAALSAKEEKP